MKKIASVLAVLGLSLACTAAAQAGGACCKSGQNAKAALAAGGSGCQSGQTAVAGTTATATGGKSAVAAGCCAGKANAKACTESDMPKLAYKVGDKTVTCPVEAKSLAAANETTPVRYVVGGKEYTDQLEANKAYATVLTSYMSDMLTVREAAAVEAKKCPVSGSTIEAAKPARFELASYTFENRPAAEKAAAAARDAASKVTMSYAVAGKTFHCSDEAKKACTGDTKVEYVIGDVKSCCDVLASVELAKARITAANQVLASATSKTTANRM